MKKLFAILSVALLSGAASFAQDVASAEDYGTNVKTQAYYDDIWGKGRYTHISYSIAQTGTDFEDPQKAAFGFAVTKGTTYRFPKKPLAGMIKVGFDINWVDISMAKYKNSHFWDVDLSDDLYEDEFSLDIGRWNVMIGAFGVGPNVQIAPFSNFNNAAKYLKAQLYFHYQPTFGMYIVADSSDTEISYSYCNMFQFGGNIMWKFIGIGIEGHWGSGNFKQLNILGENDSFFGDSGLGKIKRRFANTRIYLSVSF
ncbi:MAG: hypothetical protein J1E97_06655 [Muribaculaceae bacterium]|nr:hypothetical protein [Muribaculaceae bacterium]